MAIGADATIQFWGTETTVTAGGGTAAVGNGNVSASSDAGNWTNSDDAPYIVAALTLDPASAPSAGTTVDLYARQLDITDAGDDAPQTDASYLGDLIGAWLVDADAAAHTVPLIGGFAALPNAETSAIYQFYIRNNTGVSIDAGWTIKVRPVTVGPHA